MGDRREELEVIAASDRDTWIDSIIADLVNNSPHNSFSLSDSILASRILQHQSLECHQDVNSPFRYFLYSCYKVHNNTKITEETINLIYWLAKAMTDFYKRYRKSSLYKGTIDEAVSAEDYLDLLFSFSSSSPTCPSSPADLKTLKVNLVTSLVGSCDWETALLLAVDNRLLNECLAAMDTAISGFKEDIVKSDGEPLQAILAVRDRLFERLLDAMDEDVGGLEAETLRQACRIVVKNGGKRGVVGGQLHVGDIESALQMARNGGSIFLCEGEYEAESFLHVRQASADPARAIRIVGESVSQCSIKGNIRIEATSAGVTFHRVKFELGEEADSEAGLYLLSGQLSLSCCQLEVMVNTGVYVYGGKEEEEETVLNMEYCTVEGLESCQRAIAFDRGCSATINLRHSRFSEMFSLYTSLATSVDDENPSTTTSSSFVRLNLTVQNCCLKDVQDGIRHNRTSSLAVAGGGGGGGGRRQSTTVISIVNTTADMVLYDSELFNNSSLVAVAGSAGSGCQVTVQQAVVRYAHIDGRAIVVEGGPSTVTIGNCLLETTDKVERKMSTSVGLRLGLVIEAALHNLLIRGFRVGCSLQDCLSVTARGVGVKQCSLGILSTTQSRSTPMTVSVSEARFEACFQGVVLEDGLASVTLAASTFYNVLLPALKSQSPDCQLTVSANCLTEDSQEVQDCQQFREADLKVLLAVEKNLPYQVSFDHVKLEPVAVPPPATSTTKH